MYADDLILIAVGGAASQMASSMCASGRLGIRVFFLDTDDTTANVFQPGDKMSLHIFGTSRLNGKTTGGDTVVAKSAFNDEAMRILPLFGHATTAIILTCTGGGTSGAVPELLKLLHNRGIATMTIATQPFTFEGQSRKDIARRIIPHLEEAGEALALLPLDVLCEGASDIPLPAAFECVRERLSATILLLCQLITKPGFIAFDSVRFNAFLETLTGAQMRFASVKSEGDNRALGATMDLFASPLWHVNGRSLLLSASYVLVGIVAGDDLRLSEIGNIMTYVREQCQNTAQIELGTATTDVEPGSLTLTILAVKTESDESAHAEDRSDGLKRVRKSKRSTTPRAPLGVVADAFANTEVTYFNGANLDTPTYERRQIRLKR